MSNQEVRVDLRNQKIEGHNKFSMILPDDVFFSFIISQQAFFFLIFFFFIFFAQVVKQSRTWIVLYRTLNGVNCL